MRRRSRAVLRSLPRIRDSEETDATSLIGCGYRLGVERPGTEAFAEVGGTHGRRLREGYPTVAGCVRVVVRDSRKTRTASDHRHRSAVRALGSDERGWAGVRGGVSRVLL